MKQLKTLALFTVLFVMSACSASGNNGGSGDNGGGSTLTGIVKELQGTWKADMLYGRPNVKTTFEGLKSFGDLTGGAEYIGITAGADDTVDNPFFGKLQVYYFESVKEYFAFAVKDGKLWSIGTGGAGAPKSELLKDRVSEVGKKQ